MKTQTLLLCQKCDKPIDARKGHIVQGNIYVISEDVNERGGLVGNSFPEADEDGNIRPEEIKEYAYHYQCLNQILMDPMKRPIAGIVNGTVRSKETS